MCSTIIRVNSAIGITIRALGRQLRGKFLSKNGTHKVYFNDIAVRYNYIKQ